MKKFFVLLMTIMLMFSMLSGCTKKDDTPGTTDESLPTEKPAETADVSAAPQAMTLSDETVTIAISTEPNTIIPDIAFTSNDVSMITALMYETLFYSDYVTLEPTEDSIVEKSETIDDTHFRLTLRKGIKFHNGDELTTADVLYTFQEAAKGGFAGEYSIYDIANFKIEDDYNIIFALVQPWAQGQERLAFEQFFIINKSELEAAGGSATTKQYLENAGTGKYVFKEWIPGDHITVVRNDNYWNQEDMPYFKEVKFVFINDTTARGMAAQSGDVDIAMGLDLANYNIYNADSKVKAVLLPTNLTQTIFLNSGMGGPLEDVRIREAVYRCLDKQALMQVGASGIGEIQDTIISTLGPMWDGVKPEVYQPDYEKAKKLLADAGYADGLTLRLRVSVETALTSMIKEQLYKGGINVDIVVAEFPVHFAALAEGDFDMYTSSQQFAYYTEPVRCTDGIHYKFSDVMGGCGYKNEEYAEIAARCYASVDLDARKAAYAELQKHFRENYVSVALYSGTGLALTRPDIENLGLRGMGIQDIGKIYSTGKQ